MRGYGRPCRERERDSDHQDEPEGGPQYGRWDRLSSRGTSPDRRLRWIRPHSANAMSGALRRDAAGFTDIHPTASGGPRTGVLKRVDVGALTRRFGELKATRPLSANS